MTKLSDARLAALAEEYETMLLLQAVDAVDRMRERLSDDGNRTPELRDRLLNLHKLSMDVITRGQKAKIGNCSPGVVASVPA